MTTFLNWFSIPVSGVALNLLLPVGISFYTFQTLSYVIDVYRKNIAPENNFIDYALYVSFFPQLVAGPIERPENLLPQFKREHFFNYEKAVLGCKQIALGAFKKIVIADSIASSVNMVFNDIGSYQGFALVLATLFFAIQIYCDFSGYTDIALGSAKLLGFDLMENFRTPYFSTSISDFWSRWHISLSTWFKDYVYIPLGGSKSGAVKTYRNLLYTFLLSGLWHGANWTFVLWGAYHGVLSILQVYAAKVNFTIKLIRPIQIVLTFALVCVGWAMFRANSISDLAYLFTNVLNGLSTPYVYVLRGLTELNILKLEALYVAVPIFVLLGIELASQRMDVFAFVTKLNKPVRYAIYFVFTYTPIFYFYYQANTNAPQAFIYFQF